MPHDEDCSNGYVGWDRLLGYMGDASYQKNTILPEIALSVSEVTSKWNIFTAELCDNLQCGVKDYRFNNEQLNDKHYYVDDVLFVSANGVCFTEAEHRCGHICHTYSYDDNNGIISLSDAPDCDEKGGLKVRIRYGIDINDSCCLPKRFVQKYGSHIINYMLYKRAIRGEAGKTTAQVNLLYRDAVEYFQREQWMPYKNIGVNLNYEKVSFQC